MLACRRLMHASHQHPVFVVLSLVVAIFGAWTALDLFRRVRTHAGATQAAWLATAAVAMGASIWSMHFVAMLGFDPGSAVAYDPLLTVTSLLLAICATCGAFFLAARPGAGPLRIAAAGTAMGGGICAMHYVGMAAVQTAVSLGYRPPLVALSLAIAVIASTAALVAARRERSDSWRAMAAVILGGAIVGMHYTAMAALELKPLEELAMAPQGAPPFSLAVGVAGGTLLILFLALVASLYDQRGNVLLALDGGGVGYWEMDLRNRALHLSVRGKAIFGYAPDDEVSYLQLGEKFAPEDRQRRRKLLESAIRSGADYDAEYRLSDPARWVNIRGRVVQDGAGRPRRMVGVVLDVTDRHEAFAAVAESERRQKLLINELNHRVKNTLATIQSIAGQTARGSETIEQFRESFEARLMALSLTHNVLTRGGWREASLREILDLELRPYAPERISAAGPDLSLTSKEALALGMVFHELATNAAKYGALSSESGHVGITWSEVRNGSERRLVIDWTERGGPPAAPPTRRGFGSRLIVGSIQHELGGKAELRYEPAGFSCRINAPLAEPKPPETVMERFAF